MFLFVLSGIVLISCDEDLPTFSFDDNEITIEVGESYNIGYDLSETVDITWVVTPDDIIEVTNNSIKGLKVGDATVKASISGVELDAVLTIHVVEAVIDVESISISGLGEGVVGEDISLSAAILPENASNQAVTWSSSDEALASVDQSGKVSLLKAGKVTITATADGKSATHVITISDPIVDVSSVEISGDAAGLTGATIQLSAVVAPTDATNPAVSWSSSDEMLATVDQNGLVNLLKSGIVTITATADGKSDTHQITITDPVVEVESVSLTGVETDKVGSVYQLTASILPANATDQSLTWSSSDEQVVSVSAQGEVTLISVGQATITVTSANNKTATLLITVEPIEAESVSIDGFAEGEIGEELTLVATILPANTTNQSITWSSSDDLIATVSNSGVVSLLQAGTVSITATTANGMHSTHQIVISEASQDFVAYINEVGYTSLQAAIDAASEGAIIFIEEGTHSEDLSINKNVLTFTSLSDNPAVLTGVITIDSGVSQIGFDGLDFTENASIVALGNIDQFGFANNHVYDTTLEASAYYPSNRVDVNAFIRFYTLSGTNVVGDVVIDSNTFENMSSDIISIARTSVDKAIVITNNTFTNFVNSAIRFDGGYNNGDYIIRDNVFKNDMLSGYNAILFRAYSPSSGNIQNIYIEDNLFENIGETTLDRSETYAGSAVIAMSTFNDKETHINIHNNDFINTFNTLHLRNVTSTSNWHANITGNLFDASLGYVLFETLDVAVFDQNYILDDQGQVIDDVEVLETIIVGNTSYAQHMNQDIDLVMHRLDIDVYDQKILVNPSVASLQDDEVVVYESMNFVVGQTAFATIADAMIAAQEQTTIYLASATYDEDFVINTNHLMFVGPNHEIDPILDTRQPEAILTGDVTLASDVSYITMSGLAFTEEAQFTNEGPIENFLFKYNKVDSNLSYATGYTPQGFIEISSSSDEDISKNIIVMQNAFNFTNDHAPRYLLLSNIDGLYVVNNVFESSTSAFTDIIRITGTSLDNQASVGINGDLFVYHNTFNNAGQSAIFITTYTSVDARFIHNVFNNIRTSAIRMRYSDDLSNESEIMFNFNEVTFDEIYSGYPNAALRVERGADGLEVYANYNHFVTVPEDYYIGVFDTISVADAKYNFYAAETDFIPVIEHFSNVSDFGSYYTSLEDLPLYEENLEIHIESLDITNEIATLDELATHQLEVSYLPDNATHKKLIFESSDESVAVVDAYGVIKALEAGLVTITVYSENDMSIFDSFELEVEAIERLDIHLNNHQAIEVGETATLSVDVYGSEEQVAYTSSDESILVVTEQGEMLGVSEGMVDVTVSLNSQTQEVLKLYVYGQNTDPLLKALLGMSKGELDHDVITYIGSDDGSKDYDHIIGESVSSYLFNDDLNITQNMISSSNGNYSGQTMSSIEWIVIHDTANSATSATAQANSNWATNPSNSSTAWHYTVGNDGYFKQLEDTIVGYHAGDGTSVEFAFYKTEILATDMFPLVMVSNDGYYEIDGALTTIEAPLINGVTATTADIVTNGIRAVIGDDGYYYLPLTYQTSSYGGRVAMHGGNLNSIGIESAVNKGSDVWLTWQKSAKLISSLLLTHDLSIDRAVTHNHFSGKPCPRTMMTSGHLEDFYEMIAAEYDIMSNYSDYQISFTSHSDLLDDHGRVVEIPLVDTVVTYDLTITTPSQETQTITLSAIVQGSLFNK